MGIENYMAANAPDLWVSIFVTMAGLFCLASINGFIDRKPFMAGFMAFTSAVLICTVAMAVTS